MCVCVKTIHRGISLRGRRYTSRAAKEFRGFSVFPTDRCQFSRYRVTRPGKREEHLTPGSRPSTGRESREIILLRCSVINFFLLRELHTPETHPFRLPRGGAGSAVRSIGRPSYAICSSSINDEPGEKNTRHPHLREHGFPP